MVWHFNLKAIASEKKTSFATSCCNVCIPPYMDHGSCSELLAANPSLALNTLLALAFRHYIASFELLTHDSAAIYGARLRGLS